MPQLAHFERVIVVFPVTVKEEILGAFGSTAVDIVGISDPVVLVKDDEEDGDLKSRDEVALVRPSPRSEPRLVTCLRRPRQILQQGPRPTLTQ